MRTYLDPGASDLDPSRYCPECGQSLSLAPKLGERAGGDAPRWSWLVLGIGLLLALGFGAAARAAHRDLLATTALICGTGADVGLAATDERAIRCLRQRPAGEPATEDWLLGALHDRQGRLATAAHGLVAAALIVLLGASALARPRPADLHPRPAPRLMRAWASLEQAGFTLAGLYLTLGVLAVLHATRAGAPLSPDLIVQAVRAAVDAPFRAAVLLGSGPGP
jgi:hypothetical protein